MSKKYSAKPARLDPNGTEKPLTRIVHHPPEGGAIHQGILHQPEYEADDGERTSLRIPVLGQDPILPKHPETCLYYLIGENPPYGARVYLRKCRGDENFLLEAAHVVCSRYSIWKGADAETTYESGPTFLGYEFSASDLEFIQKLLSDLLGNPGDPPVAFR